MTSSQSYKLERKVNKYFVIAMWPVAQWDGKRSLGVQREGHSVRAVRASVWVWRGTGSLPGAEVEELV